MMKMTLGVLIVLLSAISPLSSSKEVKGQQKSLKIMSYNIRYDNPDDAPNNWDNRKERVASLIQFYEPAFIGTQEALLHQLKYLETKLHNYNWIGVGRDDGSASGEFSALFYDSTKVDLISGSEQTIWLSKTPSSPSKSWDAALPRILTYGQFRDKSSGEQFFVFNTHFDHRGTTARMKSSELILDKISEIATNKPVVVTGDFNATPDSKPYAILTSGEQKLRDAFEISSKPHLGPIFTYEGFEVQNKNRGDRIDYIFLNEKAQVLKHAIIPTFRDYKYPSDHLPVLTEIIFDQE